MSAGKRLRFDMKQIVIKPEQCIGCRSCELICSMNKYDTISPRQSAVTVYVSDGGDYATPIMCMQCDDPVCAAVCPVEALKRNEATGAVEWTAARCIHCGRCAASCPLGNIRFDAAKHNLVKCNLCNGHPSCVNVCPVAAIEFLETAESMEEQTIGLNRAPKLEGGY